MAIGAIAARAFSIGRRAIKMSPNYILGNGHEVFGKQFASSMKASAKTDLNWFQRFGVSFKKAGKAAERASKNKGCKEIWQDFRTIPNGIKTATTKGYKAGTTPLGKLWGGVKGFGTGVGAKLPVIGSLLMLAFELPNICKATANEGIVSGAAETVKAGAKLAGGLTGAAIGQTLIPIPLVGGLVGWFAGEWLASKVVGKSYSERTAEQEEKVAQTLNAYGQSTEAAAQAQQATNPYAANMSPQQQMLLYQMMNSNNTMNDDIMYNAYKATPQLDVKA